MRRIQWAAPVIMVVAEVFALGVSPAEAAPKVPVVAAEDFWGSIARQLGGEHVEVKSIIDDPETHAHDYEPKPSDGAAFAGAKVAIINGIGYDPWANELLEANPSSERKVVNVGDVVGVKEGGNPHQWYSPRNVDRVIDAVTDALKQAAPPNAAFFDTQRQAFRSEKLKRYNEIRAQIKAQFQGTPVGATESIFSPLAEDLGLKVLTPLAFQDAIAEGEDPTAADKATVDKQITGKQIKVLVYNSQNSTPDVAALLDKAKKAGIPVTTVTETPNPKGTLFQDWQVAQLEDLAGALAQATGKPTIPPPAPAAPASPAPAPAAPASPPPAAPAATPRPAAAAPAPAGSASTTAPASPSARTPASVPTAPPAGEGPSSALAHTGAAARWLVPMAGTALALGGLGLTVGAARRRSCSAMRGA
jgi:zinc/manganese transport system substrate-binding protein